MVGKVLTGKVISGTGNPQGATITESAECAAGGIQLGGRRARRLCRIERGIRSRRRED